jgi:hypothetical protein
MNNTTKTPHRMTQEFLIWRAAQSVDWQCTNAELAAETGFGRHRVGKLCKENGWSCRLQVYDHGKAGGDREAVDVTISEQDKRGRH